MSAVMIPSIWTIQSEIRALGGGNLRARGRVVKYIGDNTR